MKLKNLFICVLLANVIASAATQPGNGLVLSGDEEGLIVRFGPDEESGALILAFFDPQGHLLWERAIRGSGSLTVGAVVLEGATVFITGSFTGGLDFETTQLESAGKSDAFVAGYTSYGECLWVGQYGGKGNALGHGLVFDRHGLNLVGELDGVGFMAALYPHGKGLRAPFHATYELGPSLLRVMMVPVMPPLSDLGLSEEFPQPMYVVDTEGVTDPPGSVTEGETTGNPGGGGGSTC